MNIISRLLSVLLIGYGMFSIIFFDDQYFLLYVIFILWGLGDLMYFYVFKPSDREDERTETIKNKSGLFSFVILQSWIIVLVILHNSGITITVNFILISLLFVSYLSFPLTIFIFNRKL
ncbi:MAG: hypothetical protein ACQEV7_13845 [Bacillota bacterium]